VLTRVPPDCTVLGVASSVIVTMVHLVTMWMVAANACQDIQESCARKSVPMAGMGRTVKKSVPVRMMESVTWWMVVVIVVLGGRDHSARRGFVREKSCMVRTAR